MEDITKVVWKTMEGLDNVNRFIMLETPEKEPQEIMEENNTSDVYMGYRVESVKLQNLHNNLRCVYVNVPLTRDDFDCEYGTKTPELMNSTENDLFPEMNHSRLSPVSDDQKIENAINDTQMVERTETFADDLSIFASIADIKMEANTHDELQVIKKSEVARDEDMEYTNDQLVEGQNEEVLDKTEATVYEMEDTNDQLTEAQNELIDETEVPIDEPIEYANYQFVETRDELLQVIEKIEDMEYIKDQLLDAWSEEVIDEYMKDTNNQLMDAQAELQAIEETEEKTDDYKEDKEGNTMQLEKSNVTDETAIKEYIDDANEQSPEIKELENPKTQLVDINIPLTKIKDQEKYSENYYLISESDFLQLDFLNKSDLKVEKSNAADETAMEDYIEEANEQSPEIKLEHLKTQSVDLNIPLIKMKDLEKYFETYTISESDLLNKSDLQVEKSNVADEIDMKDYTEDANEQLPQIKELENPKTQLVDINILPTKMKDQEKYSENYYLISESDFLHLDFLNKSYLQVEKSNVADETDMKDYIEDANEQSPEIKELEHRKTQLVDINIPIIKMTDLEKCFEIYKTSEPDFLQLRLLNKSDLQEENDVQQSMMEGSEPDFLQLRLLNKSDLQEENDVQQSMMEGSEDVSPTEETSDRSLQHQPNAYMLMDQKSDVVGVATPGTSKPVHIQRVVNATSLEVLKQSYDSSREVDSDISDEDDEVVVDDESIEAEREQSDDGQNEPEFRDLFNFDNCDPERSWITSLFQENTHEVPQLNHNYLIQQHAERKKVVFTRERCMRSMYYSVGLLSSFDKYPEIKKIRGKPPKKKVPKEDIAKSPHYSTFSDVLDEGSNDGGVELQFDGDGQNQDEDSSINSELRSNLVQAGPSCLHKKKARKFKDEESKKKWEDVMTLKRKKVFTSIVKKEVSKQHRAKMNKHKEMLIQCKRVALQCQKVVRQKALHSARVVKEQQWRMKRLARENLAYWKRSKRVDREIRRKLEKEAEEQRKMDFEFIEAKRQQRKLNFLITQTELYAHFMSKKLGTGSPEEQLRILNQLDEEKNPRLANIDDYDSDLMKAKAMRNAEEAFQNEKARTKNFDMEANSKIDMKKIESIKGEHPQPAVFRGNLKGYQLKGMNWLANLYDQGISGILADEMGLGKTVQSIAFLCHIAERYAVWGPFLIISPASTLHNWQQEIAKFVPIFKVVPYWGNPNERKILRQFWDQKDMHTKDASFHIVVTSYQIVITDIKYFNRIKWQYMILDEAQAIKSTSSMRWKTLLGFSCRNRLLLSGTPIQNSMAELWALLHFIMPTLFDSHEEFNEWFSKDIESHAENKTGIDEKHLSRLHMILKPFMLRRIKKDVENELSDKIEVMVYCPLTTRQKLLYMALKQKIRIEDLLHYTVGGGDSHTVDKNFTSNLMNLVMQFRKVCNHPELFERRDAKSPIYVPPFAYEIPFLVYDSNVRQDKSKVIQKYFSFTPQYIAHAARDYFQDTIFNFAYACKLSIQDLYRIFSGDILHRWKNYYEVENDYYNAYYRMFWSKNKDRNLNLQCLRSVLKMSPAFVNMSSILKDLTFTWNNSGKHMVYTHTTHAYHSMPETVEHRNIRSKIVNAEDCEAIIDVVNDDPAMKSIKELPYEERVPQIIECERTLLPSFLFSAMPKLETTSPMLYCYSRKAAWDWKRFIDDYSWNSLQYHWFQSTNSEPSHHYNYITHVPSGPVDTIRPAYGWSHIAIPDKETLVTDSGKLSVLDSLLKRLKEEGHRVLIYSQMTKMIDLLEEYMWHRHHKYMRLDGSSKISERRDMVADFQARTDIFVFLLSTRAGGLGINLTAADTVIFYDSDWNPTVDQQAMDRAHRLGQTKQVTVYRLICKGSIEERILQRAREKSEIQKLVISGGNFKPDTLKPKEVVSLLLDDEEIEQKYRQRTEERKQVEDMRETERKRKHLAAFKTLHMAATEVKKIKQEGSESGMEDQWLSVDSGPSSPHSDNSPVLTASEDVNDGGFLDVEGDTSINSKYTVYNLYGSTVKPRIPGRGSSKRGRPRGSRRVSALGRFNSNVSSTSSNVQSSQEVVTDLNTSPSNSGLTSFDIPGTSATSPTYPSQGSTASSGYSGSPVRRGPGRPRLKPGGPPHAGSRGPYRPRKPARPLPVPLPSDGGGNATASNSGYSSYLYDYPEQPSDS